MARPTLPGQTRELLVSASESIRSPGRQAAVYGAALVVSFGLHLALRDGAVAWLVAPLAVLAGLAGGTRTALAVAGVAALGHAVLDVLLGVTGSQVVGLLVRTAVLPALALVGTAGAQLEQQRERAVRRSVSEDPVTGLLNVRVFYDELAALRETGTPFVILLADIRGMRALNERYGHPTGTEAMRALAHVLRRAAGTGVTACRLGSDEVAIALAGDDRTRCSEIIEEVLTRLQREQVSLPDGELFQIHAAYGIARFPEDGENEVAVLRAADRAKERAKAAGLDRVGSAGGEMT